MTQKRKRLSENVSLPEPHSNIWVVPCLHSAVHWSAHSTLPFLKTRPLPCWMGRMCTAVTVCVWFRNGRSLRFLSRFWQWVGGSCGWLQLPELSFLLFLFLIWLIVSWYIALFCFFLLVNVMHVYIFCFDHSIHSFQFLHALYASAPNLSHFLYRC